MWPRSAYIDRHFNLDRKARYYVSTRRRLGGGIPVQLSATGSSNVVLSSFIQKGSVLERYPFLTTCSRHAHVSRKFRITSLLLSTLSVRTERDWKRVANNFGERTRGGKEEEEEKKEEAKGEEEMIRVGRCYRGTRNNREEGRRRGAER